MRIAKLALLLVPVLVTLLLHAPLPAAAADFDIHACYAGCGCAHGVLYACMECKAECDRKYWKLFDREMDDMTDGSSSFRRKSTRQR